MTLTTWDIFAGIGGFSLGLCSVARTTLYCEKDPFCIKVLQAHMDKGSITPAPIIRDVAELSKTKLDRPDMFTAGFPCTNISHMGDYTGLQGKESGLFFRLMDAAKIVKPKYILLENVPQIKHNGINQIFESLSANGYKYRDIVVSASDMGAPQNRRRWFCLAYKKNIAPLCKDTTDILKRQYKKWATEPVPRLLEERSPNYTYRLKSLGNAVVPVCALAAFVLLCDGKLPKMSEREVQIVLEDTNKQKYIYKKWGTPCASVTQPAHTFSKRFLGSLYTQLLYDKKSRRTHRKRHCNPSFVEWLQGYPLGWTSI